MKNFEIELSELSKVLFPNETLSDVLAYMDCLASKFENEVRGA